MVCAKVKPAVSGLQDEFPGTVRARNVSTGEPGAAATIRALGFKSHGLVIRSTGGRVLWKQADHNVRVEEARDTIRRLLAS